MPTNLKPRFLHRHRPSALLLTLLLLAVSAVIADVSSAWNSLNCSAVACRCAHRSWRTRTASVCSCASAGRDTVSDSKRRFNDSPSAGALPTDGVAPAGCRATGLASVERVFPLPKDFGDVIRPCCGIMDRCRVSSPLCFETAAVVLTTVPTCTPSIPLGVPASVRTISRPGPLPVTEEAARVRGRLEAPVLGLIDG